MNLNAENLIKNIEHDLQACETLLTLLMKEQEALKNRDLDTVSELLENKLPLLERLDASGKLRAHWAKSVNQPNDEEGWSHMITELSTSDTKDKWQTLKQRYIEVRTQNEINGKMLSRHQTVVTRILDLMRGNTSTPSLYNSTGQTTNTSQRHVFGEA